MNIEFVIDIPQQLTLKLSWYFSLIAGLVVSKMNTHQPLLRPRLPSVNTQV